jgi:hypothetical protein
MNRSLRQGLTGLSLLWLVLLAACEGPRSGGVTPPLAGARAAAVTVLAQAHAHNDYEHARPLFDALDHGFSSVEADVYTDPAGLGDLYVAHDPQDIDFARTLRSLYLEPLAERVQANGGSVYGAGEPFYLLIDIKTEAESTYAMIDAQLRDYAFMLTAFTPDGMTPGAVTVAISGNRPAATMRAQALRYAGYDGRMSDLESSDPASFMPLISDNWTAQFAWRGAGQMPADERARLREQVSRTHAAGRRIRYWATPDAASPERDALWHELLCAGVDHINTDDLAGLRDYLTTHSPPTGCS